MFRSAYSYHPLHEGCIVRCAWHVVLCLFLVWCWLLGLLVYRCILHCSPVGIVFGLHLRMLCCGLWGIVIGLSVLCLYCGSGSLSFGSQLQVPWSCSTPLHLQGVYVLTGCVLALWDLHHHFLSHLSHLPCWVHACPALECDGGVWVT